MARSYSKKSERNASFRKNRSIGRLIVRPRPGRRSEGLLSVGSMVLACALGRAGISAFKREGDGATPYGCMRLLRAYVRSGAFPQRSRLPLEAISGRLGWCDAAGNANYNRPVRLPFGASHETMLREDGLYDAVIVLDWNMRSRIRGRGSAIFLHIAREGWSPTEGCVAIDRLAMRRLLPRLGPETVLIVSR